MKSDLYLQTGNILNMPVNIVQLDHRYQKLFYSVGKELHYTLYSLKFDVVRKESKNSNINDHLIEYISTYHNIDRIIIHLNSLIKKYNKK